MWRKSQKLKFVAAGEIPWLPLMPDDFNTWLVPEHADEYGLSPPLSAMFDLHSSGIKTNRDDTVFAWNWAGLTAQVNTFTANYNAQVHMHKAQPEANWSHQIKWSETLKKAALRGEVLAFHRESIVSSLYRPFTKKQLYFDRLMNERVYQWPHISGPALVISDVGWRAPGFNALMSDAIADLHLCATVDAHQCFPLSHLKDAAVDQFRQHYADDTITKESVFHYIYAILHHPEYRKRYAANLKRELPRIPFAPDFHAFAAAGKELARLHVEYEALTPWPLKEIENKDVPFTQRVTKMKLSADKQSLFVNESLTLAGIPPETYEYRLGSRSALDWIVDQYQVKGESDPNREDDPAYIVRLVGQVVRVSVETVGIVRALPNFLA